MRHTSVLILTLIAAHKHVIGQVVHNMSSDSSSIASIRHEQALPMLIHLLKVTCDM